MISVRTPADGDGISASTLSVEISNSGSSRSTGSPTFLIHRTMVPSAIDSPIWGMTTLVAITVLIIHQPLRGFYHLSQARQNRRLERRRVRNPRVQARHPHDRSVQVLERVLSNYGRKLPSDAAGEGRLVQQQHPVRLGHALEDRVTVEWREAAQVDHLGLDSLFDQPVCGLEG